MAENTITYTISLRGGPASADELKKVEHAVSGVGGKMKQVGRDSEQASKHTGALGGTLKHLAVGLSAVGAGYAAYSGAKKAIEYTTELTRSSSVLAHATGMNIGESSKLTAVAGALGVGNTKLAQVFTKLGAATVKQAEHTGKHATAFDRLGISQKEAKEHLNDTAGVLDLVTRKLATEHIPALEKSKLLTELFGKSWLPLGRLFLEGETNFKHLTGMAKEYGLELGGSAADGVKKLKDQQEEYNLAMGGMKVAFTGLVAGPLGNVLQGFAKLTVYAKKGNWNAFNKEVEHIAKNFEVLAEKVLPRMATAFAHVAPAVLKAFWKGFVSAPIGTEAVLGLALATKFGLTKSIFSGVGKSIMKSLGKTLIAAAPEMAAAGAADGAAFEAGFAGAAATALGVLGLAAGTAYGGYVVGKTMYGGNGAEPFGNPFGKSSEKGNSPAKEWAQKHQEEARAKKLPNEGRGSVLINGKLYPVGPLGEAIMPKHHGHAPKAAMGGSVSRSGLVEVGEHGPEVVHLPKHAMVEPLKPGSLAPTIENIIKLDSRELARSIRKTTLESQAAGA